MNLSYKNGLENIIFRGSRLEALCRKGVLRNFAKFTGNNLCQSLFFNKVADLKKETLAQVFSCEFCEIFKDTFFWRTPPVAASVPSQNVPFPVNPSLQIHSNDPGVF